ncbi:hypothetical protein FHS51_004084, partial [Sphingobium wenxiniae]|uniref:hypothetical protein n=1 Tax=Sphingobium wenxiniae (strain DSM 21828 / CGMCC 1.7748 / JZ-1) TaxID=595605 RepID=UPI00161A856C
MIMAHLTQVEIANWIALYVAAGLCCGIAVILSVATTFIEIYRERAWTNIDSFGSAALFLPKTWWRWQKLYLALLQRLAAVRGRLSLCADQAAAAKWWLSMPM